MKLSQRNSDFISKEANLKKNHKQLHEAKSNKFQK